MSIFKRHDQGDVEQTITAPYPDAAAHGVLPEQPANLMPPLTPPGVVPPPAAPIYSMRPPESAPRAEGNADSSMSDMFRRAKDAQQWAQDLAEEVIPAAAPRARPATSTARGSGRRWTARVAPAAPRMRHHQGFDPVAATQTGLLNLAWHWQQAGAPIRAIHAYMELITRYPHSPAAAAAVADLVDLSEKLAHHGHFHIALGIYDQLEDLLC